MQERTRGDTSASRRAARMSAIGPATNTAASSPMNSTLRGASVPGHEYGFPIVVVGHVDTPAAQLIGRAQLVRAQSRFAGMELDLEDDPA